MTPEFIETINRALCVVAIVCGGLGMALCVPYLILSNWYVVGMTGIVFLGGAVLYAAGQIGLILLLKGKPKGKAIV